MNRTSLDLRQVFLRLNEAKKPVVEIAAIIGVSRQTIYNWRKIEKEKLLTEPSKTTVKPSFDISELKDYIIANPFAFNKEIAVVFGKSKNTIQKWRSRMGFKRKKAKTSYKEADLELKKSFKKI
jgi:transposase